MSLVQLEDVQGSIVKTNLGYASICCKITRIAAIHLAIIYHLEE